jgi:hypothetical protein
MKGLISEVSEDIVDQVVEGMKASPYFVLQLDETSAVTSCEQLLVYARNIKGESVRRTAYFLNR